MHNVAKVLHGKSNIEESSTHKKLHVSSSHANCADLHRHLSSMVSGKPEVWPFRRSWVMKKSVSVRPNGVVYTHKRKTPQLEYCTTTPSFCCFVRLLFNMANMNSYSFNTLHFKDSGTIN